MTGIPDLVAELVPEVDRLMTRARAGRALHERATAGPDEDSLTWQGLAQMGVIGLTVPERSGGVGGGAADLSAFIELAARSLQAPGLLVTAGLAVPAVVAAVRDHQQLSELLEPVLTGRARWTAAWPGFLAAERPVHLNHDEGTITGTIGSALLGYCADAVVVLLPHRSGTSVHLVQIEDKDRRPASGLDLTRPSADLTFADHPATLLGHIGTAATEKLKAMWLLALAADSLGGLDACLALAVGYAKQRTAFGQPIGAFQAIQHRCADMFVGAETTRASVRVAGPLIDAGGASASFDGLTAASHANAAFVAAADSCLLVHGGIGFTFECEVHFYIRRAYCNSVLMGDSERMHRHLAMLTAP